MASSSSSTPKERLEEYLRALYDVGLLDRHFEQLQVLQESTPYFIEEILTLFINDTQRVLINATQNVESAPVDFHMLHELAHQLKGSSSSVGARLVKLACIDLRQETELKNYKGSMDAFNTIKNEYYNIRGKFETILQLDREIHEEARKKW